MKKTLKGTLTIIAIISAFTFNAYKHFDKPIQTCAEYVQEEQLNEDICK